MKPDQKHVRIGAISLVVALVILLAPVAAYVLTFGATVSNVHQRWAEMGDAMAGLYTPILSLLTLVVILRQAGMQSEMNKHVMDESHLQNARSDTQFYLSEIAGLIDQSFFNGSQMTKIRVILRHLDRGVEELQEPANDSHLRQVRQDAAKINTASPQLAALWSGYSATLKGLLAAGDPVYEQALTTLQLRGIAILSYATCVHLDNFCRAIDMPIDSFFSDPARLARVAEAARAQSAPDQH